MKYRYPLLLLLLLLFAIDAKAQLALDDISKILKPLKSDVSSPSPELITVLDTLNDKGYVRLPDELSPDTKALYYENAVDTIRKQTIALSSAPGQDKQLIFSVTVTTRDMAEFNGWLKSIRGNLDFITDKSTGADYATRLFKTTPTAKEKQSYKFSTAVAFDAKTKKHKYVYQVVYVRRYVPADQKSFGKH
ncbi:MAG: hypothetical protein ACXVJB_00190 [Mucilaginibacter sp.]